MTFRISDYTWPAFQDRKPYQHQRVTVEFLITNKRAFVLNEMGTGKTLSALWACDILMHAKRIRRVLIICPLSTMGSVWYNEIRYNLPHRYVGIAHGRNRTPVLTNAAYEFVIMNHDGPKYTESEILNQQFDIIIIDELTAFKSHKSDRSKCVKRICDRVRAVWGMTGDLTPNRPTEAWFPCRIVNPINQWLPKYYGQFHDACMTTINEYVEIPKPEAPQIVAMCAQPAIRFTRAQCLDLPDTSYQLLEIPLTVEQQRHYDSMLSQAYLGETVDEAHTTAQSAAIKLNKLLQISAGAVKTDTGEVLEIGCEDRLDQLHEIFEQTPQRKLLVFATYRASILMIVADMKKRGVKVDCIHGDVASHIRTRLIDQFQTGDLEMLVVQPQSAAHGITLTAASTIVWFSLIASNEYFQQGNARIIRAGQTRKTLIILMIGSKAEKHIARILRNREQLSTQILKLFADREF